MLKIGLTALSILAFSSIAQANLQFGEMTVIEKDHGRIAAALRIQSTSPLLRIILGNPSDYNKMGYAFNKDALGKAILFFSKSNDQKSAIIRIDEIKTIKHPLIVILKDPISKSTYAYRIKANPAGSFNTPVMNILNPSIQKKMPKLKVVKNKYSNNRNIYPRSPQPAIITQKKVASNQLKQIIQKSTLKTALASKYITLNNPKLLTFGMLASHNSKQAQIQTINGNMLLQLNYPATNAAFLFQQYKSPFRNASTKRSSSSGYFSWVTTNKYIVSQDDTAITDIIHEIKIDPSISVDAAIAAIWQMNKKAFSNETIYSLMKGSILNIPPRYFAEEFQNNPSRLSSVIEQASGTYRTF